MSDATRSFIESFMAQMDLDRHNAATQLTIGELILSLEKFDLNKPVKVDWNGINNPGDLISYRGYYSDLCIETGVEEETVGHFIERLRATIGATFSGYKGGDFTMRKNTLVWVDQYGGAAGFGVASVDEDGDRVVIGTTEVDA